VVGRSPGDSVIKLAQSGLVRNAEFECNLEFGKGLARAPSRASSEGKLVCFFVFSARKFGTMLIPRWRWEKLLSYGEVVCFVTAWAVGLLLAADGRRPAMDPSASRSMAATSESLGIQAKLHR